MDILYIIIGIVLALIIISALIFIRIKNCKTKKIGIKGEKKVAKKLYSFSSIRGFKVINDIYFPLYDKTTQVDHVLIGFFGILVIETKNLSGEVYGDPKKQDWLHIMGGKNREKKHKLYNPLLQNQTHIDCIRHILGKENIYNIQMESLVVFANTKLQLFIPKKLPIITINKLSKYLRHDRFQKDNNIDVDLIYNTLMKYKTVDKKLLSRHNKNVKSLS